MEQSRRLDIVLEKQRIWREAEQRVAGFRDGLGRMVDPSICDVLVACMVNGLPTRQSCGGHIAYEEPCEGWAFPWICFAADRPDSRWVGEADIRRRISQAYGVSPRQMEDIPEAADAFYDAVDQLEPVETEEFRAWSLRLQRTAHVVRQVIEQVHETHPFSALSLVMRNGRLEVNRRWEGGRREAPKNLEELAASIREARTLFERFGLILKDRFFESE